MKNNFVKRKYIGVKMVEAATLTLGAYNVYRGWKIPANEDPSKLGYLVCYPDGYESWCPKEQFEESNQPSDCMRFGHAIEAARKGMKIARRGWNGKNMFVFLRPGHTITGVDPSSMMGGDFESLPHFCMRAAGGECVVGWLASQTDMLADDWEVVT